MYDGPAGQIVDEDERSSCLPSVAVIGESEAERPRIQQQHYDVNGLQTVQVLSSISTALSENNITAVRGSRFMENNRESKNSELAKKTATRQQSIYQIIMTTSKDFERSLEVMLSDSRIPFYERTVCSMLLEEARGHLETTEGFRKLSEHFSLRCAEVVNLRSALRIP
ncbi:unnamed protein product [Nippostrongylus brasiliensis]|uniref:Uncharacterized protein n=1 Tax=Nippostrongylus brasiliensis TaxID=27835 RepID=A0A0N4YHK7_NIPBR|nr:unnamed protein product [Nippostrongylus brasiliensis]